MTESEPQHGWAESAALNTQHEVPRCTGARGGSEGASRCPAIKRGCERSAPTTNEADAARVGRPSFSAGEMGVSRDLEARKSCLRVANVACPSIQAAMSCQPPRGGPAKDRATRLQAVSQAEEALRIPGLSPPRKAAPLPVSGQQPLGDLV